MVGCWTVYEQGKGNLSSESLTDHDLFGCSVKVADGVSGMFMDQKLKDSGGSAAHIDYMRLARDYATGEHEYAAAVGLPVTEKVHGGGPDYTRAADAYRQAAACGNPLALYNLGVLHIEGLGVQHDNAQGASLLSAAADRNVTAAQYLLATLHFKGEGVAKDQRKAFVLFLSLIHI